MRISVRKSQRPRPVRVNSPWMRIALPTRKVATAVVAGLVVVVGCTRRSAAPAAPAVSGYIDEASDSRRIVGWAWDKSQPNAPVTVEIYDDGVRLGTVPADAFRQDLLNAGV